MSLAGGGGGDLVASSCFNLPSDLRLGLFGPLYAAVHSIYDFVCVCVPGVLFVL